MAEQDEDVSKRKTDERKKRREKRERSKTRNNEKIETGEEIAIVTEEPVSVEIPVDEPVQEPEGDIEVPVAEENLPSELFLTSLISISEKNMKRSIFFLEFR